MSIRPIEVQGELIQNHKLGMQKQYEHDKMLIDQEAFAKSLEKEYDDEEHRVVKTEKTEFEKVKKDNGKKNNRKKKRKKKNNKDNEDDKQNNDQKTDHIDIKI